MKAKFVGDPNDDFSGPKVLNLAGTYFPKDRFVGVSDELASTLSTHNHFEVEKGDAPAYVPSEADVASTAPKAPAEPTGKALTKAEVLERLKAYPDAEYDPSSTVTVLRGVLEDAEFAAGDE